MQKFLFDLNFEFKVHLLNDHILQKINFKERKNLLNIHIFIHKNIQKELLIKI